LAVSLGSIGKLRQQAGELTLASAALRAAIELLDGLPSRTPEDHYNLACYHSRLAGMADLSASTVSDVEGSVESKRAMDELRHAASTGFRMLSLIAIDEDLDPLRARADFKLLMMDLMIPSDPFAP
jgi:hypothetical protein